MFFRREKPRVWTFDERIASLRQLGFESQPVSTGKVKVTRKGYGAMVETTGGGDLKLGKAGLTVGNDIAELVNAGYQMFFMTPQGKQVPALAAQLKALHNFDEDLREGLGLTSLYNLSLGTTSGEHLYDRVEDRDEHAQVRPWEKKSAARP